MSGGAGGRSKRAAERPLTVALYVRVSHGEATRGQRDTLLAWARREGWRVAVRYEDHGSGMDGAKRSGLRGLLEGATSGAFERVLVTRRDRFARHAAAAARWETQLARHGVQVWSHDEPLANEESPTGLMMRRLLDLLAEHYAREVAERVRGRTRARLAAGQPLGPVPFGYRCLAPAARGRASRARQRRCVPRSGSTPRAITPTWRWRRF